MLHSLQFRLLGILTLVVLVALGTVAILVSRATTTEYERSVAGIVNYRYFNINAKAEAIQKAIIQNRGEREIWIELQNLITSIAKNSRTRIVMADLDGNVYADSSEQLIGSELNTNLSKPFAAFLVEKTPILAYAEPIDTPQLQLAQQQFTNSVNRSLLLAILIASIVAILLTAFMSKSILRPIEAVIAASRQMEKGDFSQRVDIEVKGEIGELANAFNAMADGIERLEQLRRNMVSDVAHELRTPLSNIRGYLEAIQDGFVEPDSEMINSLYEEALLLNQLIDDLQELALAEARQIKLNNEPIELPDIAHKVIQGLRPQIQAKELTIELDFPEDLGLVYADYHRLGQVLRNLLSNAIRYTPPHGNIRLSAHQVGETIEISIHDNGEGIAPEHLPFVFERFYRADHSRARTTGGAGLGLAIVKQLVEAQGGDVNVNSRLGQGTTFSFTLPATRTVMAT